MSRPKKAEKTEPGLSESDLMHALGHRIRGPLVRIVERADMIMPNTQDSNAAKVKSGLAEISGEAYKILDVFDWMLALLDVTLKPGATVLLDPAKAIRMVCSDIESSIPAELSGYRLIRSIPESLPMVIANGYLLRRALQLMIGLLGNGLQSSYVHLDVEIADSHVIVLANTLLTTQSAIHLELENLILDAVARLSGGKFEQTIVDQHLVLTLCLPIAK